MTAGTHGTTFGGNPLACAIGDAVLDVVLADGFLERVQDASLKLKQKLASLVDRHPAVFESVRGEGLLLGLRTRVAPGDVVVAGRASKILTVAAGDNVVRLLPPLTISDAEIDEALVRLEKAAVLIESKMPALSPGAAA
jgi:acetylornithine/N-succinyldiaminopimelate aminotransferase